MGVIIDLRERGGDVRRFEESLKMAKAGIKEACEIFEDMKEEFSERGGSYGERYNTRGGGYSERGHGGYYRRDDEDWDDMRERRYRDSRGRYM